jgi:hypothetical protein
MSRDVLPFYDGFSSRYALPAALVPVNQGGVNQALSLGVASVTMRTVQPDALCFILFPQWAVSYGAVTFEYWGFEYG